MTPLDPALTVRRRNLVSATVQVWSAVSVDGVWAYERVEDLGTPWEITHLPTGVILGAGTLAEGRRQTCHRNTLVAVRDRAARVVADGGRDGLIRRGVQGRPVRDEPAHVVAERLGKALRVLAVLDGRIGAGAPVAVCRCGGYLAEGAHADACRECLGGGLAERRQCRNVAAHVACGDPDPVVCDHRRCLLVAGPLKQLRCAGGRDWCCGCCRP